MAFRLLHTADWQIGMKAAHVGAAAERVRAVRLEAARRVVQLANQSEVHLLVLAGDTFEDSDVPRQLVQQVVDILRGARCPVLVLPANHDPLVPGGVYEHPAWRDVEPRVSVLRTSAPLEVGEATIFPAPLSRRSSPEDPTGVVPSHSGARDRIRIGIAHGSLRGAGAPDAEIADDFPIDRGVVERGALDYLALGHWHVPSTHEVGGAPRIAYCGSHEPTKFGEFSAGGKSGQCLLVTIDRAGAVPLLEALPTSILEWRQERRTLAGAEDLALLRAQIDREPDPSRGGTLYDLVLAGWLPPAALLDLLDLADLARERFLHARIRSSDVRARAEDDSWIEALPAGVPRAVAAKLSAIAGTEAEGAAVARTALELLYRLDREVRR